MRVQKIFTIVCLVCTTLFSTVVHAQFNPTQKIIPENPKQKKPRPPRPKVYKNPKYRKALKKNTVNREFSFGFGVISGGWNAGVDLLKLSGNETKEQWHNVYLNFGTYKHPRETRVVSTLRQNRGSGINPFYKFGKINALYPVRLGYSQRIKLTNKLDKNHVKISAFYGGGFTLGILKPYYLKLNRGGSSAGVPTDESYNLTNAALFADPKFIYGSSSWTLGFSDAQYLPGLHLKGGLEFEYQITKKYAVIAELGIQSDFFFSKVPILIDPAENSAIMPAIYVKAKMPFKWGAKEK